MTRPTDFTGATMAFSDHDYRVVENRLRAMPSARAGRPTARALLRGLGYSATIAIAGCTMTPQQQAEAAQREAQRTYDDAYDHCIYRVTGPFAGASIEVMHECARQAREGRSA